ncbi:MAG: XRE family transcriptional regulator [Treponema phagedenis]|uniref:LexA family transcriptional regulator n=1 Tax=Treponema phagedenis TaxID=162 RepID=UPI00313411E1
MDLTNELRDIRKKAGKTQKEFAQLLNIPQTTWASYEVGKANPPLKILEQLASMGYVIPSLSNSGIFGNNNVQTMPVAEVDKMLSQMDNYTIFKYDKPVPISVPVEYEHDPTRLVLLPFYNQKASAGPGEEPTQLQEVNSFIPVLQEVLRGANPASCGITQVKGDSMTDVGLFSGDFVIFNTAQTDGDGIYVITINGVTRIKRLENRPIEKKIIISSENAKRYPTPEILSYDQATEALTIHGKVIGWIHRHFY